MVSRVERTPFAAWWWTVDRLLLAAPVPDTDVVSFRAAFTAALERFGFPLCPGNVMVRNPQWSQPVENFIRQIRGWIMTPDEASATMAITAVAASLRAISDDSGKKAAICTSLTKGNGEGN